MPPNQRFRWRETTLTNLRFVLQKPMVFESFASFDFERFSAKKEFWYLIVRLSRY